MYDNLNPTNWEKLYPLCKHEFAYLHVFPQKASHFFKIKNIMLTFQLSVSQEFAGEDTSDLFLEERETALRQAQEEKHKLQMSVPGILNPHEIPEEMCD